MALCNFTFTVHAEGDDVRSSMSEFTTEDIRPQEIGSMFAKALIAGEIENPSLVLAHAFTELFGITGNTIEERGIHLAAADFIEQEMNREESFQRIFDEPDEQPAVH